jgi:hypothetical protein
MTAWFISKKSTVFGFTFGGWIKMIKLTQYSPIVLKFDDMDRNCMKKVGITRFFEIQKELGLFDISAAEYYNGAPYFVTFDADILCIECAEMWIDELQYLTFCLEDVERSCICTHCGNMIEPAYGYPDDECPDIMECN